ncbi:probable glutathione S-transferase [Neltuma alba]|uniref:probable glutathione S-transferase n=1 Tax=Neltuma alba TaxID=207710 RepID=UPI0010A59569|nr:probable glutathione S-transferase [Prosopis alba]
MGEVRLIATPQSFPCARIEWVLKMKGVEYEYIKENLLNKSDLLLQSNPVHKKVPVLLHNGLPIAESLVILEYIDETWKQNPLLPQDPCDRAHARFWAGFIDEKCVVGVWRAGVAQGEGKGKAIESAVESLAVLEKQIEGKKYFGGEEIGYLDIVAGWIPHWLNVVEQVGEMELLTAERFPHLHQWSLNLQQTSPFNDCLPPRNSVVDYYNIAFNRVRSVSANK